MNLLLILLLVIFLLTILVLVGISSYKGESPGGNLLNKYCPYKTKKTLMTSSERILFEGLRKVLGSKYDIYPQVNLDKIFSVEYQRYYKYYLSYLRKINQKSVDYLVVNRQTQSPIFAIELDDFSHNYEDRRKRDSFVGDLFIKTGLPLIRFNPGNYKIEEIKKVFERYLV